MSLLFCLPLTMKFFCVHFILFRYIIQIVWIVEEETAKGFRPRRQNRLRRKHWGRYGSGNVSNVVCVLEKGSSLRHNVSWSQLQATSLFHQRAFQRQCFRQDNIDQLTAETSREEKETFPLLSILFHLILHKTNCLRAFTLNYTVATQFFILFFEEKWKAENLDKMGRKVRRRLWEGLTRFFRLNLAGLVWKFRQGQAQEIYFQSFNWILKLFTKRAKSRVKKITNHPNSSRQKLHTAPNKQQPSHPSSKLLKAFKGKIYLNLIFCRFPCVLCSYTS